MTKNVQNKLHLELLAKETPALAQLPEVMVASKGQDVKLTCKLGDACIGGADGGHGALPYRGVLQGCEPTVVGELDQMVPQFGLDKFVCWGV